MKRIYTCINFWLLAVLLSVPVPAFAQTKITNPLRADSITGLIADILDAVLILAVPVIVLFIIYAGFLFVTAGGDEQQIETAKTTALYTLIGAAIILGAELISNVLAQTAANLGADVPVN